MSERFSGAGNPFFGKTHTDEVRQKLCGRKHTEETKAKMRRPRSIEGKTKIAEAARLREERRRARRETGDRP